MVSKAKIALERWETATGYKLKGKAKKRFLAAQKLMQELHKLKCKEKKSS